jgi:alkaline phosphatase D
MSVSCKKSYLVTLLLIAIIISPVLISNAHATAPQIHFKHRVASGDVTSESAVLWSQTDQDGQVTVQVSKHPNFQKLDFESSVHATADSDFTVKSQAVGLKPDTLYYYRFKAGPSLSEIGNFKTSPLEGKKANTHFTWSGDTDVSKINGVPIFGDWLALDAIRSENSDFFIYLGDIIYSDLRGAGQLPDAQSLDEFRQIYKDSHDVPALHELLKSTSVYPVWDDHEVRNDWAGQTVDPTFFEIGKKSFNEYTPIGQLHSTSDSDCAGPTQFRVKHWGKDIDLIMLDTRTCRSPNVETQCEVTPGRPDLVPTLPSFIRAGLPGIALQPPAGCLAAINDPERTMLGTEQKELFKDSLLKSNAKFKFVVTSVSIQQTFAFPYDSWEGYGAERSEILNFIRDNSIQNVIFLTTDLHMNLMNDVFIDLFTDPAPISYEFVTGPIGAETDKARILRLLGPAGPIFVQARESLLTLAGANCRNIDSYSYGSAILSKVTGELKITLKDQDGDVLHDDVNPNVECSKSFGNLEFQKSMSNLGASEKNVDIEDLKAHWDSLQNEKSTTAKGHLGLGSMTSDKTDPFA